MDLAYTDKQNAFRDEVRTWLAENVPAAPLPNADSEEGFAAHREWERTLSRSGWSAITWPIEHGGRGCDLVDWLIFEEEYWRAGAPQRINHNGILLLAPTLMDHGNTAQRARFLGPMVAGDEIWSQGWSEPNAGSDIGAIRCSATRAGSVYVLNGIKTWTRRATWSDWLFGLFRSTLEAQATQGLTLLLVPLKSPGITVRPIRQLNGLSGIAEVRFDNVEVPVENRVGEEGVGWQIAQSMASGARGLMLRSPARFQATAQALLRLYQRHQAEVNQDPSLRDAVLRAWMDAEAYALMAYRIAALTSRGKQPSAQMGLHKIFWSELDQMMHDTALQILGARGELVAGAPEAEDCGRWVEGFLFAQAGHIYPGTNEIHRNNYAERTLGLRHI